MTYEIWLYICFTTENEDEHHHRPGVFSYPITIFSKMCPLALTNRKVRDGSYVAYRS